MPGWGDEAISGRDPLNFPPQFGEEAAHAQVCGKIACGARPAQFISTAAVS